MPHHHLVNRAFPQILGDFDGRFFRREAGLVSGSGFGEVVGVDDGGVDGFVGHPAHGVLHEAGAWGVGGG